MTNHFEAWNKLGVAGVPLQQITVVEAACMQLAFTGFEGKLSRETLTSRPLANALRIVCEWKGGGDVVWSGLLLDLLVIEHRHFVVIVREIYTIDR